MMDSWQEELRGSCGRNFTRYTKINVSSTDNYTRCTYDTFKKLKDLIDYKM